MSLCFSSEKLSLFGGQITLSPDVSMRDSIVGAERLEEYKNGPGSLASIFSRHWRSSIDSGPIRPGLEISAPQLQSSTTLMNFTKAELKTNQSSHVNNSPIAEPYMKYRLSSAALQ
jgi:hypothetical protein